MIAGSGTALGGVDLFFFVGYLVAILVIGIAMGLREKATVGDYFRAHNRLKLQEKEIARMRRTHA